MNTSKFRRDMSSDIAAPKNQRRVIRIRNLHNLSFCKKPRNAAEAFTNGTGRVRNTHV